MAITKERVLKNVVIEATSPPTLTAIWDETYVEDGVVSSINLIQESLTQNDSLSNHPILVRNIASAIW